LHRAGRSARPKLRSLERNKKDVAPRTRRHVRADRHARLRISRRGLREGAKLGRRVASPETATTDFLAPDILNKCGRAVPAVPRAPQRTRETDGGAHKKKGRLRCRGSGTRRPRQRRARHRHRTGDRRQASGAEAVKASYRRPELQGIEVPIAPRRSSSRMASWLVVTE
jgi:hypothetical protein